MHRLFVDGKLKAQSTDTYSGLIIVLTLSR